MFCRGCKITSRKEFLKLNPKVMKGGVNRVKI